MHESSSLAALLHELEDIRHREQQAGARASVLAIAGKYLIGDVREAMAQAPETIANALEGAIYRYEERIK